MKSTLKSIHEVLHGTTTHPLSFGIAAFLLLEEKTGQKPDEVLGDISIESTLLKLECALYCGAKAAKTEVKHITKEFCMEVLDQTPSVYGSIHKSFTEAANKWYGIQAEGELDPNENKNSTLPS